MALEKIAIVDQIEVVENGSVQVRTCTSVMEDGKRISGTFHRHVIAPGDDYSNEDPRVQAICAVVQTPNVVANFKATQQANKPKEA